MLVNCSKCVNFSLGMKKLVLLSLVFLVYVLNGQTDTIDCILKLNINDSIKIDKAVDYIDYQVKTYEEKVKLLNYLESKAPQKDSQKSKAFFLFQYGQLNYDHSKYTQAIQLLYKALPLAEETHYIWLQGKIYNYLGIIFSNQGDSKKAVSCFIKTYEIAVKMNDLSQQFVSANNVAVDLTTIGEYKKALYYLTKSENVLRKVKSPKVNEYLLSIHGNKLEAYISLGDQANAKIEIDSIEQRYRLEKNISIDMKISYNEFNALYYMFLQDYNKALKYLEEIQSHIPKNDYHEQMKLNRHLNLCYEKLQNYKMAYNSLKVYFISKDSIASSDKLRASNEFEENYKNLKIENDLKIANLTNANNELKLKRNRTIIYLGGSLILILAIAFFIVIKLYRNNKQKNVLLENQKNLIEEKQTEILSSIRYAKRIQESLFPSQKYISRKINK